MLRAHLLLLPGLMPAALSEESSRCHQEGLTQVTFAAEDNVSMEWRDALGQTHSGSMAAGDDDTSGGFAPGGELRWRNLGSYLGATFDLLVTVAAQNHFYDEQIQIGYVTPINIAQASFTSAGFACLGIGLLPSYCPSGAALDATSASCTDGSSVVMRAAECTPCGSA